VPRPPRFASAVEAMPGAVYAPTKRADLGADVCPLNVGDTWMEPFEGGRMEDISQRDHPGLNRYAPPKGAPALVDALVEKVRARNGIACERESVLVAAGATGALCTAVGAFAEPSDEVLILAPFWPLIRGIVQAFRAKPVEVPFYDRVDSADDAVAAVRERITERTVALYVSTPSNPTGRVLPRAWLEALAELARRHDLWLIADEVYEDLIYAGEHVSIATFAPERTLSTWSFSKAYGMAGFRTGYLVGPPAAIAQAEKIATHTFYCAPTAGQIAALRALRDGRPWVDAARESYRKVGAETAELLGLPAPAGSTFHFVDVGRKLDERGIAGFLEACYGDGVALAPGASSGTDYASWVRLCYTAAPPGDVIAAVRKLAARLA